MTKQRKTPTPEAIARTFGIKKNPSGEFETTLKLKDVDEFGKIIDAAAEQGGKNRVFHEEPKVGDESENERVATEYLKQEEERKAKLEAKVGYQHLLEKLSDERGGVRNYVTFDKEDRLVLRMGLPIPEEEKGKPEGSWLNWPFVQGVYKHFKHEGLLDHTNPSGVSLRGQNPYQHQLARMPGEPGPVRLITRTMPADDDMYLVITDHQPYVPGKPLEETPVGKILQAILQKPEGERGRFSLHSKVLERFPQLEPLLTGLAAKLYTEHKAGRTEDDVEEIDIGGIQQEAARETVDRIRNRLRYIAAETEEPNRGLAMEGNLPVYRIATGGLSEDEVGELRSALKMLHPNLQKTAVAGKPAAEEEVYVYEKAATTNKPIRLYVRGKTPLDEATKAAVDRGEKEALQAVITAQFPEWAPQKGQGLSGVRLVKK